MFREDIPVISPNSASAWPISQLRVSAVAICAALALTACAARIDTHGFMPNPGLLSQVEAGAQDKNEIREILGTPSAVSTFDDQTWYYVTQRTENLAFFKPEIIEQRVLAISFDTSNIVADVSTYTLEDGLWVDPIDRKTPTAGKELSIIQQLFGNVGRFSK